MKLAKHYQKLIKLKQPRIVVDVNLFIYRPPVVKRGDKSLRTKTGWFQACPERRRYNHTEGEWTTWRSRGFLTDIPFARISWLLRSTSSLSWAAHRLGKLSISVHQSVNIPLDHQCFQLETSVGPVTIFCASSTFDILKYFLICSLTCSHMYHVYYVALMGNNTHAENYYFIQTRHVENTKDIQKVKIQSSESICKAFFFIHL